MEHSSTSQQERIWQMFNHIAPQYDQLNRILSLGIDRRWRNQVASEFADRAYKRILDAATGTGDLLFAILQTKRLKKQPFDLIGIDMAEKLLEIAIQKASHLQGLNFSGKNHVHFRKADACLLPYGDASFQGVSIGFGIRNIPRFKKALQEFYRVLQPGGKLVVLEFGLPRAFLFRWIYLFYFRHILPRIGGWLSKNKEAYQYLNQSVESFPYGVAFLQYLKQAGFTHAQFRRLSMGIAYLYVATK